MKGDLIKLLSATDSLKFRLDEFRPLINEKIQQAIDIEYTYESNRIEGNTLTLRETDLIIQKGLTIGGKSMREHLEAINHYEAILYIRDLLTQKTVITQKIIQEIHALVLRGIDRENAGVYRKHPVAISGSRHQPPQAWLIPKLMEDLELWIAENSIKIDNSQTQKNHAIIFASEVHERLVTIHPFIDGNGRTARLLMNFILLQNGYPIANISGDTDSRLAYYAALEKCNIENDKSDFYYLMTSYVMKNLQGLLQRFGLTEV